MSTSHIGRQCQSAARSRGLREENHTLYGVIKLVSSSLELIPMLQGIVELATEATGCHACFIYLLERQPADNPGGLAGVRGRRRQRPVLGRGGPHRLGRPPPHARVHPRPRDGRPTDALRAPAPGGAVPIDGRGADPVARGRDARRDRAPHRGPARVHRGHRSSCWCTSPRSSPARSRTRSSTTQERRRVDALTGLSALAQEVADARDVAELGNVVTGGARVLLGAEVCQLYRLDDRRRGCSCSPRAHRACSRRQRMSAADVLLDAIDGRGSRPAAQTLWPEIDVGELLVAPLTAGGERVGLLCAGSPPGVPMRGDDTELARAVAHLAAVAIKRVELIEGLTNANIVKDLFEALAAGATAFAAVKAAEVRCDLGAPYVIVCAEPARGREPASGEWRAAAEELGRGLAELAPRTRDRGGTGAGARAARARDQPRRSARRAGPRLPRARTEHRRGDSGSASRGRYPAPPPARTARRATRRRSAGRCSARAARSRTQSSGHTAISSTSMPTTRRRTGCAPRSTS